MRPLIVPQPVTTPSPGTIFSSMPKSVQRWVTNMSYSSKLFGSSNTSNRSRAVSLPFPCWVSIRRWPPPSRASPRLVSNCSMISCMWSPIINFYVEWSLTSPARFGKSWKSVQEHVIYIVNCKLVNFVNFSNWDCDGTTENFCRH